MERNPHPDDIVALIELRDATNGGVGDWGALSMPFQEVWDTSNVNGFYSWYGVDTVNEFGTGFYRVKSIHFDQLLNDYNVQ